MIGADDQPYTKTRDMHGIPVEVEGYAKVQCPMEYGETRCPGWLTIPYQINDLPQFAIACTKCGWWDLPRLSKDSIYLGLDGQRTRGRPICIARRAVG